MNGFRVYRAAWKGLRDPARHPEGQKVGDRTWGLGFRRLGFRGLGFRVFFFKVRLTAFFVRLPKSAPN